MQDDTTGPGFPEAQRPGPDPGGFDSPEPAPADAPPSWPGAAASGAPRPWRGRSWLAAAAWLVIAATVVLRLAGGLEEEPSPEIGDPVGELLMRMQGRYLVGAAGLTGSGELLYRQSDALLNAGTVGQRQRFIVLAGEMAGANEARRRIRALDRLIEDERESAPAGAPFELPEGALEVQRILATLYAAPDDPGDEDGEATGDETADPDRLSPSERAVLVDHLGWFGDLALVPDTGADSDARRRVLAPALRTFVLLFGAAITGGAMAVLGFAGLVVVLVFLMLGKLRSAFERGLDHHGVYAETFALWLVGFLALQVVAGLLASVVPELGMPAVIAAFFASLLALAWPILRGVPWQRVRRDIGWTAGRGVARELALGGACYLMALPILAVGILLTWVLLMLQGMLADAPLMFAPAGGPAHPIIVELGSGDLLLILQVLVVGAVAAPIVEETMFRGVLYRHLRDASVGLGLAASIIASTLVNTFVFAIIHPQGWVAVPALMSLAISFTLVREWRGTLIGPMVMHGVSNGILLTLVSVLASG